MQLTKTEYLRQKLYYFYVLVCLKDKNLASKVDFNSTMSLSEQVIDEMISKDFVGHSFLDTTFLEDHIIDLQNENARLKWLIKLVRHGKNSTSVGMYYFSHSNIKFKNKKYSAPADLGTSVPLPDQTFRNI